MHLPFTRHELANGLRIVLHHDEADPLVAVHLAYHVGSGREEPGRSGFAHLFEHMLFQGSENVPKGAHFGLVQEAGGTLNGSTNQDLTRYWEKLPRNRLDLALWLESDRMGFLLPAMTQAKLDNQRDVVKNERRQSYEERPYGRTYETVLAALYPEGHPYHHPTIGSMADIDAATLDDVRRFFERWYGPNNAVLVVAGAFDPTEVLGRIEHWFGGLPPGPPAARPAVLPPAAPVPAEPRVLTDDVSQPQLTLAWPAVHRAHPDRLALSLLVEVLSAHRAAVLDRALTVDERLASHVTMGLAAQERAGHVLHSLRPHAGVGLDVLAERVGELLARVATEGPSAEDVAHRIARAEGRLLRGLEALETRAAVLAEATLLDGDPGAFARALEAYRELTPEDVRRVCGQYLVDKPSVAVETVPRAGDARPSSGWRAAVSHARPAERARASSRAEAPPPGNGPPFAPPPMWRGHLGRRTAVAGTPYDSLPLGLARLALPAGRAGDPAERAGRAVFTAALLRDGTRARDVLAWTEALDAHGATLSVSAGDDDLVLELRAPTEHLAGAVGILAETVFTPRFAEADFERRRAEHAVHLRTRPDRPRELADDLFRRLVRGADDPLGRPRAGEAAALEALGLEEVRAHWDAVLAGAAPRLAFVGEAREPAALGLLAPLAFPAASVDDAPAETPAAAPPVPAVAAAPGIYLLDRPGSTQCELRVGHRGPALYDPEFHRLLAVNAILGGTFSSRLNLNLREEKGVTYGVQSAFQGGLTPGQFFVGTAVDTDNAALAVGEILRELRGMHDGVRAEEVEFVRATLTRRLLSTYASLAARATRLDNVLKYGFPPDYPLQRLAWLEAMTAGELDDLARRHLRPDACVVVVVGDAARVAAGLRALDAGPVVAVDAELAPDLVPA